MSFSPSITSKRFLFLLSLTLVFFFSIATFADASTVVAGSATEPMDMQQILCNILGFVTGTVGKTLASFVIIGVGIGFFSGKVSWGLLVGCTLGVSALFGATTIIGMVTGEKTGDSGNVASICAGNP
jgi:type IV secretory pathway VirB2 component (pilin)